MPTTVQQFLNDAITLAGGTRPNQTASGTQIDFARRTHGHMVQGWQSERLRLFFIPEATYSLASTKNAFQIGPGAPDFDTTPGTVVKPIFVQAGFCKIGAGRFWPLNILTAPQWSNLDTRGLTDPDGPLDLYYDFGVPLGVINVSPKPGTLPTQITLTQWNPLRAFVPGEENLNIEDFYPPEYIRAMKLGLALDLKPFYNLPIAQEIAAEYVDAIQVVERINADKLQGAFGFSRTLQANTKGESGQVSQLPNLPQQQPQQ